MSHLLVTHQPYAFRDGHVFTRPRLNKEDVFDDHLATRHAAQLYSVSALEDMRLAEKLREKRLDAKHKNMVKFQAVLREAGVMADLRTDWGADEEAELKNKGFVYALERDYTDNMHEIELENALDHEREGYFFGPDVEVRHIERESLPDTPEYQLAKHHLWPAMPRRPMASESLDVSIKAKPLRVDGVPGTTYDRRPYSVRGGNPYLSRFL